MILNLREAAEAAQRAGIRIHHGLSCFNNPGLRLEHFEFRAQITAGGS